MLKQELRKEITNLSHEETAIRANRQRLERIQRNLPGKSARALPMRDERIIIDRWVHEKPVDTVAKKYNVTRGRVSQITKDAEVKLLR